jgi:hypothetical protein
MQKRIAIGTTYKLLPLAQGVSLLAPTLLRGNKQKKGGVDLNHKMMINPLSLSLNLG